MDYLTWIDLVLTLERKFGAERKRTRGTLSGGAVAVPVTYLARRLPDGRELWFPLPENLSARIPETRLRSVLDRLEIDHDEYDAC